MRRRGFLQAVLASGASSALGADDPGGPKAAKLLAVNSVASSLDILDARSLSRSGRIRLGARPREVVASLDGTMAYVAIYGPGVYGNNPSPGREIAAIDVKARSVANRVNIGPHSAPHGMAVAPDGFLWVTCETEGAVILVDPSARTRSKAVVATVPVGVKGPHWLAMTPDGSKIYAANKEHPVLSVIDTGSRRLSAEVRVPGGVEGLCISSDGRRVFAASLARSALWLIDPSEDRAIRESPLDEPGGRVLATADGSLLLVTHYQSGTLGVYDLPSLRRRGKVPVGRSPSGLAISPDGKSAFVASWADGTITSVDLTSLRILRTASVGDGPDGIVAVEARSS